MFVCVFACVCAERDRACVWRQSSCRTECREGGVLASELGGGCLEPLAREGICDGVEARRGVEEAVRCGRVTHEAADQWQVACSCERQVTSDSRVRGAVRPAAGTEHDVVMVRGRMDV